MLSHPLYVRMPTENESPYFKNRSSAEAVISVAIDTQKRDWMLLHGFVVLPEALEMVVTPVKHSTSGLVAYIQSETIPLLAILLPNAGSIWDPRHTQIRLDSQRALDARLEMLLLAPVASGIVEMAAQYPYSSASPRYIHHVDSYTGFARTNEVAAAGC